MTCFFPRSLRLAAGVRHHRRQTAQEFAPNRGQKIKEATVHPPSKTDLRAPAGSRLGPSSPAAHERVRLGLLPPGPDPVRGVPLRRTWPSTPLADVRPHRPAPRVGIQSRCSGLRVQGTASSPPSTVGGEYTAGGRGWAKRRREAGECHFAGCACLRLVAAVAAPGAAKCRSRAGSTSSW